MGFTEEQIRQLFKGTEGSQGLPKGLGIDSNIKLAFDCSGDEKLGSLTAKINLIF